MGVISARFASGIACFVLTWRGAKTFAARTGESAALVGGEDGGLTVAVSVLETEETDSLRVWAAGRLERNP